VRRRLGSGGFATVWLAHDEQLDAEVAIKVLADNWAHDESVRHRFLEEGRFLRRVESEHVVQVHDVGELEDGRPFLVLTYADRGTLADRLKKEPLPIEPAVGVIVQVGRGLQALHRRGLLHRDVKPANVLFRSTDEGERAVLSDLGLGKSLDEVSRITMPGGTPSYVAPEQAMGERLDQRADQYSLGAVAYAALTGRSPHQVDGLGAAGRVNAPPPPSSLGFDIPDKIDAAIVRALDPDREKRWPDVESFARELVGALDETTHNFLPAGGVGVSLATAETAVGEQTALSDSNLPTVVKNPGDGATEPATTLPGGRTAGAAGETDLAGGAGAAHAAGGAAGGAAAAAGITGGGAGGPGVAEAAGVIGTAGATTASGTAGVTRTVGATGIAGATQAAQSTGVTGTAGATQSIGATGATETAGATQSTGATGAGGAVVETLDTGAAGGGAGKPRRKRGRWVVAAVLALLLGGGAGFAVQRFLLPATEVDVKAGNFSVRMPKEWAQAVAQSPWKPPGQKDDWPALRASSDDNWAFTPETSTPGLFVGLMPAETTDPAKMFPDAKQYGCQSTDAISENEVDGQKVLDQYSYDCPDGSSLLQRIVVVTGSTGDSLFMQVKVPAPEIQKARDVANSVAYG
jgi:hypothetical protein